MGLTDLLTALDEEAAAELEQARRQAEEEARRIAAEARSAADALRAGALAEAEAEGRRAAARLLARARAEVAAEWREAREEALREVLDRTEARLAGLRDSAGHDAVLAACLAEALAALPAAVVVHVDRRDADLAGRELSQRDGGSPPVRADLDTWGGCVVADGAGRFVDDTLETRLRSAWPAWRAGAAARWAQAAGTGDGGPAVRP
ncbi:V-type ATP synthase subunit E family protein [Geodermatophilus sp. DSM 44513]|uniref:V-type ATP synthase subunit E family protein n=1 Tax=Geodermatophilus sp. DSM 44513 TaxID=1528104 RepID=UPI0012762E05|nr:V-type ATP synthase subunit E family protein [Geodermatophilus sp. DSM 44513]WNV77811.1 V-type ATP synthase subunit E family protein [Geodermatophilus sp. DSM 44513]